MTAKILFQLDVDAHPSSFDGVVAVDAGVDHLFQYGGVDESVVEGLVHGGMFTRGGDDLKNTAIFIGGNNVIQAETLFRAVQKAFFGDVRVSVMLDASGCNTTAAAAVVSASKHVALRGATAVVLGGTGPVGRRVAQILGRQGSHVILNSRSLERAQSACRDIIAKLPDAQLEAAAPEGEHQEMTMLASADILIACGAAGVELVSASQLHQLENLKVAIDLNAVPPSGIGGVEAFDKAKRLGDSKDALIVYGPIGIGGLKMRAHKAAIAKLFSTTDQVIDADEVFDLTKALI